MYNCLMSKNIVIFGDSHVFFYTQNMQRYREFRSTLHKINNKEVSKAGSFSTKILNSDVRLIWRLAKTAFSSSVDYFNTMFEVYAYDLDNIDYVIFQNGSTDMEGILAGNGYLNTEECIDRYLSSIAKFSDKKTWEPIVMLPLFHDIYAPEEQSERWISYLVKRCEDLGLRIIDVFDVIDKKFVPEPWDTHHLNQADAAKSLKYLIEQLS